MKVENKPNVLKIEREDSLIENIYFMHDINAEVIELNKEEQMQIFLDIKEIYDNREWGRNYSYSMKDDMLIVAFEKRSEEKEDKESGKIEHKLFLVIKAENPKYDLKESWTGREYHYDKARGSRPFERYVYHLTNLKSRLVAFSLGDSLNGAVKDCNTAFKNYKGLSEKYGKELEKEVKTCSDKKIESAYSSCVHQLMNSIVNVNGKPGFRAGLPWFFQVWSRDDCISVKALIELGKYREAKDILFKYLHHMIADGRIPNWYPGNTATLGSADAVGILFLRLRELIDELKNEKMLDKVISKKEIEMIKERLHHSIYLLRKYYLKEGMIYNKALETWMDTGIDNNTGDTREGFRLEIQALMLGMYKLMHELSGDEQYKEMEKELKWKVREKFMKDRMLIDGITGGLSRDETIRPNVFLAAYYYYDLLDKEEWKNCFKSVLSELWLPWGGIASIDKSNPLFVFKHTGENNRSYHRGDSWFFVNNIAAMMMYKTDKELFDHHIRKIVEASTMDVNENGIIGAASELSSASEQDASGSLCQTWSAATYIEMINTVMNAVLCR